MIECSRQHGVQVIELNRPEKKNAFTGAMYDQLREALVTADADASVSVILLTGRGDAFSAGNDLQDFLEYPPDSVDAPPFHFLNALVQVKKPIVAAVNGLAVGVGATMLFHCDLVYAQDSARFSFPFVALGLIPEGASSLLLPRLAGHRRAAEALLFGDPLSAGEAREIGLINRVVSDQPVLDFALSQALRLSRLPAGSVLQTKALLRNTDEVLARIALEAEAFVLRTKGPAAREAFAAFLEKRKPDFSGLD
ncbi:enoyl-CoA hydratase [Thauera butanivorans]|uniref:enoyl-CoA hydratase n=1 Tax=Thauera butanivorans TaxID=86174 RepID=UPI000838AC07|nr:enoyl-CoA hydratase [Thauera butanivorans]